MVYAGLFNSSYQPTPLEKFYISTPNDQLGPTLTALIIVGLLQGVMFVQYYEYIQDCWHEKRWTKWFVHLAFFLCFGKFVFVCWFSWDRFVSRFGDWGYLVTFNTIEVPVGISTTLPCAVCQLFYISRCWILSHNWVFLILVVSSLLLTIGSGIVLTYAAASAVGGSLGVTKFILTSVNVSLSSALVCDILITTFTCFYLIRRKTGFTETDTLVVRLTKCSIESAAGPTVVALINLVLNGTSANNQWFLLANLVLSHVYGCSLFYSVNARKVVGRRTQISSSSVVMSPGPGTRSSRVDARTKPFNGTDAYPLEDCPNSGNRLGVFVDVHTITQQDPKMHDT